MTNEEFKKKVIRANWYDKYYYYLLGIGVIGLGIFLIHDIFINPEKYRAANTYLFCCCLFPCTILLGFRILYLVSNRYKILTVSSTLSPEEKKQIISTMVNKLSLYLTENKDTWFHLEDRGSMTRNGYNIYLNIDNDGFYISIQGKTIGKGGFIDFGGTEKFRHKIINAIKDEIAKAPVGL